MLCRSFLYDHDWRLWMVKYNHQNPADNFPHPNRNSSYGLAILICVKEGLARWRIGCVMKKSRKYSSLHLDLRSHKQPDPPVTFLHIILSRMDYGWQKKIICIQPPFTSPNPAPSYPATYRFTTFILLPGAGVITLKNRQSAERSVKPFCALVWLFVFFILFSVWKASLFDSFILPLPCDWYGLWAVKLRVLL